MALPIKQQAAIWGGIIAVFLALLWFLGDVILPFLTGGAIAYFLDPLADRLEKWGLGRAAATTVISLVALLVVVAGIFVIVPLLVAQATALIQSAPQIFSELQAFLTQQFPSLMDDGSPLRQSLVSVGQTIQARGGELLNTALSSAINVVNAIVFMVVVPVVAFYMLLDWDRMVARVDELLPRDHRPVIRQIAADVDRTLAGFVRGQGTVCLILGTFYAIALMVVGLQFGLVVGLIAGLLTFIPYVGALVGGLLSIGLALFQFWGDWWSIAAIAIIFQVGQMLEGNVLTPKLVGSSVGLHPVWLIFALSAFGAVFGFVGLLVAVPVAAVIGVLVRFAITRYQASLLYRGLEPPQDD